jgi:hypothetical protein
MSDSKMVESSRRALLGYYNSQTMTHGGYIIALVIGILTLVSRWTEFSEPLLARIVFLFLISFLVSLGLYIVGRTLLWGALAYNVLDAQLYTSDEPNLNEHAVMFRLYTGAKDRAYDQRKWLCYFDKVKPWAIIIPLMTIILGLLLLILSNYIMHSIVTA